MANLTSRCLALAALLVVGGCAPAKAPAGATIPRAANAEYVFYDVTGSTPAELWSSMRAAAPLAGQQPAYGLTSWNVTWRTRWGGTGQCRVTFADVQLQMRVTMPRWTPPADASPELVAQWETFIRALAVHEAGHASRAAEAARQVRRALEGVSMPTCGMMELRTRAVAEQVLNQHRARDRDYDAQTRRGATQGAIWPPRRDSTPP